jgi:hypothetical protein
MQFVAGMSGFRTTNTRNPELTQILNRFQSAARPICVDMVTSSAANQYVENTSANLFEPVDSVHSHRYVDILCLAFMGELCKLTG